MLNDAYQEVVESMTEIGVTAYKSEVLHSLHEFVNLSPLICFRLACLLG